MGWYLFQLSIYCLVAWSDMRYRWSGWKHGDPIWPILCIELAAMWAATVIVSTAIDVVVRWRGRQRHIGRGPEGRPGAPPQQMVGRLLGK